MKNPKSNQRVVETCPGAGQSVKWPDSVQWVRQIGFIGLLFVVWLVVFVVYMNAAGNGALPPAVGLRAAPARALQPTTSGAAQAVDPAAHGPGANTTAGGQVAAGQTPAGQAAAGQTPAGQAAAAQVPAGQAAAGQAPAGQAAAGQVPAGQASSISFARDVLPIFQQRCSQCHGARRQAGGVALSSYDEIMQAVVPGDPNGTDLVSLIQTGMMPRNSPPLVAAQVQTIIKWIQAGAQNN